MHAYLSTNELAIFRQVRPNENWVHQPAKESAMTVRKAVVINPNEWGL